MLKMGDDSELTSGGTGYIPALEFRGYSERYAGNPIKRSHVRLKKSEKIKLPVTDGSFRLKRKCSCASLNTTGDIRKRCTHS
jgi:hypothetical protein